MMIPSAAGLLAGWRKWAILVAVLFVGLVGVFLFQRLDSPNSADVENVNGADTVTTTNQPGTGLRQITVPITADADKDGLTDQRERELGTNEKLADTDGDGLSDYEEVEIYKSDPLKQDTDGDGYPDGEEVRTGNSPTGPGSIRNLENIISNINAQ